MLQRFDGLLCLALVRARVFFISFILIAILWLKLLGRAEAFIVQ